MSEIKYIFGTVITIPKFDYYDVVKRMSLQTFGVEPEPTNVKVSRRILKDRIYEDMRYSVESLVEYARAELSEPEEW